MNRSLQETNKSSVRERSALQFKNLNYIVKTKENQNRYILKNIKGTVHAGHVIAILGPSGAGKTTLLHALTLSAFYGAASGTVQLNNIPLDRKTFIQHCYHVEQHDKHWPYLTCKETLRFAAELYHAADDNDSIDIVVNDVINKMGLDICKDTKNARLSGGQWKRLSIGIALLKNPSVLYLDEPTSGLDAAAAKSVMAEIVRIARDERLIVVCTIHQPSTKVYNSFDGLMILSDGREAYNGNVKGATDYFESIGYPCPEATNPAEHFLDLANSDFSDEGTVNNILDTWEQLEAEKIDDNDVRNQYMEKLADPVIVGFVSQASILFRRHFHIVVRDPILYLGRFGVFLLANSLFGFVYWNARADVQSQATGKVWAILWFMAVPMNMAAVAVYVLNDEYKSISRESKNGMINALSYASAKTILVLPILILFSFFSIAIPLFAIQDAPIEIFGFQLMLLTCLFWVYESLAECLSVAFDDPILGMLAQTSYWFASFLFGGLYISVDDMYPPFTYFYYITPFGYYIRSAAYQYFDHLTFAPCTDPTSSAICTPETSGLAVLQQVSLVFPVLTTEDTSAVDFSVLLAMGAIFKIGYFVLLTYKANKFMQLGEPNDVGRSIARQPVTKSKGYEQVKNSKLVSDEVEEIEINFVSDKVENVEIDV